MPTTTKYSICDIGCQLHTEAEDGKVRRVLAHDNPMLARNICFKGVAAPHIHNHEDRIRVPLKRVGDRGEDRWEEIPYDQAMDEIAARLKQVVEQYGPESLAVSTSGWNTQTTHATDRRFMNLLGSPNWISGVALCAGNTAAVNRLTYGWFPQPDYANTKCIVLFGHNPPQAFLDADLQRHQRGARPGRQADRAGPAGVGPGGDRRPAPASAGRHRRRHVPRLVEGHLRRRSA